MGRVRAVATEAVKAKKKKDTRMATKVRVKLEGKSGRGWGETKSGSGELSGYGPGVNIVTHQVV